MDTNEKITVLAIYKKEDTESINDILIKLENTGSFDLKEAKQILKQIKQKNYLVDGKLTITGLTKAKEIEKEFML
jgi:hypothetical protein